MHFDLIREIYLLVLNIEYLFTKRTFYFCITICVLRKRTYFNTNTAAKSPAKLGKTFYTVYAGLYLINSLDILNYPMAPGPDMKPHCTFLYFPDRARKNHYQKLSVCLRGSHSWTSQITLHGWYVVEPPVGTL